MPTTICTACGQPCSIIGVDMGYGYSEAWGVPHVDSDVQQVSDCCEADTVERELDEGEEGVAA